MADFAILCCFKQGRSYRRKQSKYPQNSHVIPAILRRFHEAVQASAPEVTIWGTGTPMREFLHVFEALWANEFAPTKPADKPESPVTVDQNTHLPVGANLFAQ